MYSWATVTSIVSFKSHLKDLLSPVRSFPKNCFSTYRTNFFTMQLCSKITPYDGTRAIFKKVLLGNCDFKWDLKDTILVTVAQEYIF